LAAIGMMGAGISTAQAQSGACTGGGKVSKQIAKQMSAAQDANRAKRFQEALTKMREAEGVPGAKTQSDLYWLAEFRGYSYHRLNQYADAARELESALNNPCMPESQKAERYKSLAGLYSALKNYPKAIEFANRALKVSRDPEIQVQLAQAYYLSGNNKESVRVMNELLASMEARGSVPKEQQLLLIRAACDKAGDNNCVSRVFEKLVVHYPKTEYWQNLMVSLRKGDTDDIQKLNVMRLSQQVKVMKGAEEYKEMAQLALDEKLACEAQTVLEQGFTNKVFVEKRDVDVNTRLLNTAKTRATAEKAGLGAADAAAKATPAGDDDVTVGAQYLMCGDAAKGVEVLQRGIAKGNLAKGTPKEAERVDEAQLLLGLAHLRNNNKAEAAKAFRAVKRDPTMVRIAKFWILANS
jgi:tetratricopeptide (TPR) repeat protein